MNDPLEYDYLRDSMSSRSLLELNPVLMDVLGVTLSEIFEKIYVFEFSLELLGMCSKVPKGQPTLAFKK